MSTRDKDLRGGDFRILTRQVPYTYFSLDLMNLALHPDKRIHKEGPNTL